MDVALGSLPMGLASLTANLEVIAKTYNMYLAPKHAKMFSPVTQKIQSVHLNRGIILNV